MDPLTGAVVIAGLKYIGKPSAELVTGLLVRMLGGPADAVGEVLAEPIREWQRKRLERAREVITGAATILERAGEEPQPVPGRILMPILEHSSLEEDDDLRSKWAGLLANAASLGLGNRILPGYADILRQLTPVQARIIDWMYGDSYQLGPGEPAHWPSVQRDEVMEHFALTRQDYTLLASDLHRLQLIDGRRHVNFTDATGMFNTAGGGWTTESLYGTIGLTALAVHFVQACCPPQSKQPEGL